MRDDESIRLGRWFTFNYYNLNVVLTDSCKDTLQA